MRRPSFISGLPRIRSGFVALVIFSLAFPHSTYSRFSQFSLPETNGFTMTMLPSENRAEAPVWSGLPGSFSSAPTPSTAPASPERKSRTLQGPSAKEWAKHRETIVGLYKQYPLKRVSELMKRHYGFVARCVSHVFLLRHRQGYLPGRSSISTRVTVLCLVSHRARTAHGKLCLLASLPRCWLPPPTRDYLDPAARAPSGCTVCFPLRVG